jgi:hypothetical protein
MQCYLNNINLNIHSNFSFLFQRFLIKFYVTYFSFVRNFQNFLVLKILCLACMCIFLFSWLPTIILKWKFNSWISDIYWVCYMVDFCIYGKITCRNVMKYILVDMSDTCIFHCPTTSSMPYKWHYFSNIPTLHNYYKFMDISLSSAQISCCAI